MHALRREALRGLLNVVPRPSAQYRALCAAASTKDVYDLAIVGAGLTGAALAAGLGRKQRCCHKGGKPLSLLQSTLVYNVAGSARLTRSLRIALIDRQVQSASSTCLITCFSFKVYC